MDSLLQARDQETQTTMNPGYKRIYRLVRQVFDENHLEWRPNGMSCTYDMCFEWMTSQGRVNIATSSKGLRMVQHIYLIADKINDLSDEGIKSYALMKILRKRL